MLVIGFPRVPVASVPCPVCLCPELNVHYGCPMAPEVYKDMLEGLLKTQAERPCVIVSDLGRLLSGLTCCECGYHQTVFNTVRFNFAAMNSNRG